MSPPLWIFWPERNPCITPNCHWAGRPHWSELICRSLDKKSPKDALQGYDCLVWRDTLLVWADWPASCLTVSTLWLRCRFALLAHVMVQAPLSLMQASKRTFKFHKCCCTLFHKMLHNNLVARNCHGYSSILSWWCSASSSCASRSISHREVEVESQDS